MSHSTKLGWRIALREMRHELRGGLRGFRVFLACLILGVASIAAIGTLREGIRAGLADQGAVILGGDAELRFTYRTATEAERDWIDAQAVRVAEVTEFRSMAVVGEERVLTQVKAVDQAYPLYGDPVLEPEIPLETALAPQDGVPSAVMDPVLADRMGLAIGDLFALGATEFRLSARLIREPDSAGAGIGLGPQVAKHPHALDGDHPLEARGQVERGEHAFGVVGGRIGQQELAPGQALQGRTVHLGHVQVRLQVWQRVGLGQKVRRADAVVLFQPEQGGAVTPPVVHAQAIGFVVRQAQVLHDVVGHRAVEPPEHGLAGIVQGVVEVEQPDGVLRA